MRSRRWIGPSVVVLAASAVLGIALGCSQLADPDTGGGNNPPGNPPGTPPGSVILVGAGDIANCGRDGDELTAAILDTIPGTVFTAGDNAYQDGTLQQYQDCYHPSWGRHKARTRPVLGNHEYHTADAAGHFDYFNGAGRNDGPAGPRGKGYYSYDLGEWHIIVLNNYVSTSSSSEQVAWLRADLAANTKKCTMAMWHRPRFSSGHHGSSTGPQVLWQTLYDHDADVIVTGHDHLYERFAPQTATGVADPVRGIAQFVVGSGGSGLYELFTPIANSVFQNNTDYGVIKFVLSPGSYSWQFIPVGGGPPKDSGSANCH